MNKPKSLKELVEDIKKKMDGGILSHREQTAFAESVLMAGIIKSANEMTMDQKVECTAVVRMYIRRNAMLGLIDCLSALAVEIPDLPLGIALIKVLDIVEEAEAKNNSKERLLEVHKLLVKIAEERKAAKKAEEAESERAP